MLPLLAEAGSDDKILLVKPSPGLMIWTLVTFLLVLFLLRRLAFGKIAEALEARRQAVEANIQAAEDARTEAQKLLEDYKVQLAQARKEAAEISERARTQAAEDRKHLQADLATERERGIADAQARIQVETRQALDKIKGEIADLTLQATQAVLGKKLDAGESKRLIDEALADIDYSKLTGTATGD